MSVNRYKNYVEIVEVIRRSAQGVTRPFICRGDDGKIYFRNRQRTNITNLK